MGDFKSEFFNLESMRNTLMARIGEYLQLPKKLDDLEAVVSKMSSDRVADFKTVLPSLKERTNNLLTQSLTLKDAIFAFTDKVNKNPDLQKLLKGEVGMMEFAITSLFGGKKELNEYKDYVATALSLSKNAAQLFSAMEKLKSDISIVETGIKNNIKVNPINVEEPKTWQTKGAYLVGGAAALLGGLYLLNRRKK